MEEAGARARTRAKTHQLQPSNNKKDILTVSYFKCFMPIICNQILKRILMIVIPEDRPF